MGERFQEVVMMGTALRAKMDADTIELFDKYTNKLAQLVSDATSIALGQKEESGVTITVEAMEVK